MYVTKNKDFIMTGHHNYCDGLWDISVQKIQIKSDNFMSPTLHPSIYHSRIPIAHAK